MDQGGDISGPGSEGDSTNGDDGDISSSPWHASTNLVYTGREIELLKQRPDIRNLLHKTIDRLQGDIFFDNTYPNSEEKVQLVRNTLMKSARELQLRDVCKRLDSDMDYNDALGRIVSHHPFSYIDDSLISRHGLLAMGSSKRLADSFQEGCFRPYYAVL